MVAATTTILGPSGRDKAEVTANQPDGTFKGHTNVILLDGKGETVETLYVVVTPFDGPSSAVQLIEGESLLHKGSGPTIKGYQCTDYACASNIGKKKNGMNGADSVTTTEWSAGSSSTSRTYNRK